MATMPAEAVSCRRKRLLVFSGLCGFSLLPPIVIIFTPVVVQRVLPCSFTQATKTPMAPYAFVEVLGGLAVVGEPIVSDLQLVSMIQRGLRRRALDHLALRSHLPLPVLAAAIDLSVRTLQRYAPEQRLRADATDRLVQLATLYAEGFDLFGEEKFRRWMESHLPALDGGRPVDFITTTVGIRLLRDIIGRIEHGVFG